jgi:hypothetical protein
MRLPSLEPVLCRLFAAYGRGLHRYRLVLFLMPVLLTGALCYGLTFITQLTVDDPNYVYTPTNGQWVQELRVCVDAFN